MSRENPLWGVPRIQAELHLLGFDLAESTIAKYRVKSNKPPSQTWKSFLNNHAGQIGAIDFFTVPTVTFRNLYCFFFLLHDRRQVIHFNVTEHPTAVWTAQQMIEAFPEDSAPRFLLRDRDSIYGEEFRRRVAGLQIEEVPTAPRSPWQNPYSERVIGSIRRECLDHVIVLGEAHLQPQFESLDLVFRTDAGGPLHGENLGARAFKKILEKAELPRTIRLYDMRHSCASIALASGKDAKVIADRLGHASIVTTLDTYAHVTPRLEAGVADTFDQLFGDARPASTAIIKPYDQP